MAIMALQLIGHFASCALDASHKASCVHCDLRSLHMVMEEELGPENNLRSDEQSFGFRLISDAYVEGGEGRSSNSRVAES
ncbi:MULTISPECIES: hypothetical protein [unclassified Rhizobium]|uniref:hypothetical protein n=1 Tax=unclassified Rhizobium TaxID=2613769 RepID=UPI0011A5DB9D|nr:MULTISPECIES: hypothetical protein [unclassified Rhizobium]